MQKHSFLSNFESWFLASSDQLTLSRLTNFNKLHLNLIRKDPQQHRYIEEREGFVYEKS